MVELQYIQRKNNILFKLVFVFTFPKTKDKINLRPNDFPVFLVEIIEKNEVLQKTPFSVEISFVPHFLCYASEKKIVSKKQKRRCAQRSENRSTPNNLQTEKTIQII